MALKLRHYCCCGCLCRCCKQRFIEDEEEVEDDDAIGLSHVGQSAYDVLRRKHPFHHHALWNVTSGSVEAIDQTPKQAFVTADDEKKEDAESERLESPVASLIPETEQEGHSDWFPAKLANIVSQTEIWCDITSLAPPDGTFLSEMCKALLALHNKDKKIVVRIIFG